MNIKELLEAIEYAKDRELITDETEVTIEMGIPTNNQHHLDKEYSWNVYTMLDPVFSLTVGEPFNELEYEKVEIGTAQDVVEDIEWEDKLQAMKKAVDEGTMTKGEVWDIIRKEFGFGEDDE